MAEATETKLCPCVRKGEVTVSKADLGYRVSCSGCIASVTDKTAAGALAIWDRVSGRKPAKCCAKPENETVFTTPTKDLVIKCGVCNLRRLPIGLLSALVRGDVRKECCEDPANLVPQQVRDDLVVNVCRVCKCRHFELTVKPGKLNAEVSDIRG